MTKRLILAASLVLSVNCALAAGCQLLYDKNELTVAAGGGTTGSTPTSGGGATSMGGGGAAGGTTSMGGAGGVMTGGGGATSMGGGGAGGVTMTSGTGGDIDGGMDGDAPGCSDRLLVIGVSATSVLCGTYSQAAGWSATTDQGAGSTSRPAAAMTGPDKGVGVFFQGGAAGPLRAVELTNGQCGAPMDAANLTTKAPPSAAVLGGNVQVLFQGAVGMGTDHPFHTTWTPGAWTVPMSPIDQNVFSETIAGLAANGADMLAVYGGKNDDHLYRVRFTAGAWTLPATSFKDAAAQSEQTDRTVTPGVAALDAGGFLVVFKEKSTNNVRWLTGDGATNAPSQLITGALSAAPVALARIDGGAVLAFRGTDNGVYAAVFDPAGGGKWSGIAVVGGSDTTTASPAVAAGICGHRAELAYIDAADGSIKHASLDGAAWTAPAPVGGASMKGVALGSAP